MANLSTKTGLPINIVSQTTQSPIKAGTIIPFAGSITPTGWLLCDGTAYLRTAFPDLFAQISTTWNTVASPLTGSAQSDPGGTMFRVPNLQTAFLRGIGGPNAAGVTTSLAGYQADSTAINGLQVTGTAPSLNNNSVATSGHVHALSTTAGSRMLIQNVGGTGSNKFVQTETVPGSDRRETTDATGGTATVGITGGTYSVTAGDVETRPDNVGVRYIIKAWDESFNTAALTLNPVFTGSIGVPDGSAATPALAFTSDADGTGTGIYRAAANSLGFSANGLNVGSFNSSGLWTFTGQAAASNTIAHILQNANNKSLDGTGHVSVRDLTNAAAGVGGLITFAGYKTTNTLAGYFAAIGGSKENATAGNELGSMKFYTNNNSILVERGSIDSSGGWVIGPTAPATGLSHIINYGVNGLFDLKTPALSVGNSNVLRFVDNVTTRAQIGVNFRATLPAGYLSFAGEVGGTFYMWHNNGVWYTSSNAGIIGDSTGTVIGTQTSDERLKSNIQPTKYGLNTIMQLEAIDFDMNGKADVGFGAQRTRPIVPEAVYETGEVVEEGQPNKLGMSYVTIIPILVKAIQELTARIAVLEGESCKS